MVSSYAVKMQFLKAVKKTEMDPIAVPNGLKRLWTRIKAVQWVEKADNSAVSSPNEWKISEKLKSIRNNSFFLHRKRLIKASLWKSEGAWTGTAKKKTKFGGWNWRISFSHRSALSVCECGCESCERKFQWFHWCFRKKENRWKGEKSWLCVHT